MDTADDISDDVVATGIAHTDCTVVVVTGGRDTWGALGWDAECPEMALECVLRPVFVVNVHMANPMPKRTKPNRIGIKNFFISS